MPYLMVVSNAEICTLRAGVDVAWGDVFDLTLPPGTYVWFVQSWGPGGFSTGGDFDPPLDSWVKGELFTVP